MTNDYFIRFLGPPTLRCCVKCKQNKRMAAFRYWDSTPAGDKRLLHDECAACGRKKLSQMSPAEREMLVARDLPGGPHPLVVQTMNQRERDHVRFSVRRDRATYQYRDARRKAWNEALRTPLRQEKARVDDILARDKRDALSEPLTSEWRTFLTQYQSILAHIIQQTEGAHLKHNAPIKPTVEEANPLTYITPTDMRSLRVAYSQCANSLRNFKEFLFLSWRY